MCKLCVKSRVSANSTSARLGKHTPDWLIIKHELHDTASSLHVAAFVIIDHFK